MTAGLAIVPTTLKDARAFVAQHHRHNVPPVGWLFGVALACGPDVVAVGMAGRPLARHLQDGTTVEILRVCTLGDRNASTMLYGALCRAAKALGYRRAVTYTLVSEPGTSLRAAGFTETQRATVAPLSWASRGRGRYDSTLWGEATLPDQPRVRWERVL